MKLKSDDAKNILENSRGKTKSDYWIEHSLKVGYVASTIAKKLNLDVDKAEALGYVHDIGKLFGYEEHVYAGYKYLRELGYDEEYCSISLTHSYLNGNINCVVSGTPNLENPHYDFINNYLLHHEYTIYEKIINLCDLMCTTKVVTIDKRLIDIMVRRGTSKNTQNHIKATIQLKEYFDNLLGYNLYNLFPEIKDNL